MEADEHYELIRVITSEDLLGYKSWLNDMTKLKISVKK